MGRFENWYSAFRRWLNWIDYWSKTEKWSLWKIDYDGKIRGEKNTVAILELMYLSNENAFEEQYVYSGTNKRKIDKGGHKLMMYSWYLYNQGMYIDKHMNEYKGEEL